MMRRRGRGGLYARLIHASRTIPASRLLMFLSGICFMSMSALLMISSGLHPNIHKLSFKFDLPRGPFGPSTHKPPHPANSTASAQGWFSSWRWRNPFSSNIVATEERSALPPLQARCRVYTFYEKKAGAEGEIEEQMLLAWRRAFWAQGFRPMVLGMAEAKEHGLYPSVKKLKLEPELESELMRWLAWGSAGTGGVLIDHRIIPMAPKGDYVLSSLRRCETTFVTRYEKWGHRLFSADKDSVESLLKHITTKTLVNVTTIEDASVGSEGLIRIEPIPTSFADYTAAIVKERYPTLAPRDLPSLVNAHLHEFFLRTYNEGMTVIAPYPSELSPVNNPVEAFAKRLSSCPKNPLQGSCPQNDQKCLPCKDVPVKREPHTAQEPRTFALAAVPHPYTFIALTNPTFDFGADRRGSIRFMLRGLGRDLWLRNVTSPPIGNGIGTAPRVLALKFAIAAAPQSNFSSLWTVAEVAEAPMSEEDVPWTFGFTIPSTKDLGLDASGMPGDGEADPSHTALYRTVLEEAARWKNGGGNARLRWAIEAWNLGSAEAWKFAGAFAERAVQERKQWSLEEKKFGKGLSSEEKKGKRSLL